MKSQKKSRYKAANLINLHKCALLLIKSFSSYDSMNRETQTWSSFSVTHISLRWCLAFWINDQNNLKITACRTSLRITKILSFLRYCNNPATATCTFMHTLETLTANTEFSYWTDSMATLYFLFLSLEAKWEL